MLMGDIEWLKEKDLEGVGRGLFQGTISAFAWRDWEKPQKNQSG